MITPVQQLEYGTPVFKIIEEGGAVRFITDQRKLNHKIVRKPCTLPRIGDTMQQLELFQYSMAIDLNMVYYIIQIFPVIRNPKTIVTEFGKFRYNKVLIGLCVSKDMFQDKINEIPGGIKVDKAYIYNILVLGKVMLPQYIYQLRVIFDRLCNAQLKSNSPRYRFGFKYISCLGYIFTWEGVKLDMGKLQGILDLGRTTTTNEARDLIRMVKYYRDMCTSQFYVITPILDACSCPKGRYIRWNNNM